MDDLISRQAAIDAVKQLHGGCYTEEAKRFAVYQLLSVPTAEPSLISRQAAIDANCELCDMNDKCICIYCKDIERFMKLPTADLSEYCDQLWKTAYERGKAEAHPKKGKWIDYCGGVKCDQCGFECDDTYYLGEANYCPNCGARMEEI